MRPRVFPAEDGGIPEIDDVALVASMRPRVFPAEDLPRYKLASQTTKSFNEAAGIPRGRHTRALRGNRQLIEASMRPRVFPAEDAWGRMARVFPAEDFFRQVSPS